MNDFFERFPFRVFDFVKLKEGEIRNSCLRNLMSKIPHLCGIRGVVNGINPCPTTWKSLPERKGGKEGRLMVNNNYEIKYLISFKDRRYRELDGDFLVFESEIILEKRN